MKIEIAGTGRMGRDPSGAPVFDVDTMRKDLRYTTKEATLVEARCRWWTERSSASIARRARKGAAWTAWRIPRTGPRMIFGRCQTSI